MTGMTGQTGNGRRDEETPLLRHHHSGPKTRQPLVSRWKRHLTAHVSRDWADLILILCYLITGLLDSASISVWGSFVSMQTGNTVYFGLGLANPSLSTRWIKSGTSIFCFCLGSLAFSRFHRYFSPLRRWVLAASFAAQLVLCVLAASMVAATGSGKPIRHDDAEAVGWDVLVPIALVAFQSCGQAVVSRALRFNALTSVVLTSVYHDLFSDAELLVARNVERNRRAAAPVFLVLGALMGGRFAESDWGVAGALWTAAALKAMVVVVWLVWPAACENEGEEE